MAVSYIEAKNRFKSSFLTLYAVASLGLVGCAAPDILPKAPPPVQAGGECNTNNTTYTAPDGTVYSKGRSEKAYERFCEGGKVDSTQPASDPEGGDVDGNTFEPQVVTTQTPQARDFKAEAMVSLRKFVEATECSKGAGVGNFEPVDKIAVEARVVENYFPGAVRIIFDSGKKPVNVQMNCSIAEAYISDAPTPTAVPLEDIPDIRPYPVR